jgi:hypothetical protein
MLEPRSDLATVKWRRTAFTRIDGAIDIAEDDWSLMIDSLRRRLLAARPANAVSGVVRGSARAKFWS